MAKRDAHITNKIAAPCCNCPTYMQTEAVHIHDQRFYCADCCPLCRELEAAR